MSTVLGRNWWATVGVAFSAVVAVCGCFELTGAELCAPGYDTTAEGARLCVAAQPIVIETGFDCPAERPYRFEGDGVTVCSDSPTPPPDPFSDLLPMPGDGTPPDTSSPADGAAPSGGTPDAAASTDTSGEATPGSPADSPTTDDGLGEDDGEPVNEVEGEEPDEPDEPEIEEPDEPDEPEIEEPDDSL